MALPTSSSLVEKFSASGFPTWQTKLQLLLMREGMWGTVSGDDEDPGSSNGEKYKQWRQRNDRAIALIGLSLADSLVHHIDFKSTAKQMWEKLESIFGNKITNSKVFLKLKFYDLKMSDHEELSDHLAKFWSLVQQLTSLKCEPDDEDKMAVLTKSMQNVSRFQQSIEVLRLASTTFDDMVALLLEKDRRIKEEQAVGI